MYFDGRDSSRKGNRFDLKTTNRLYAFDPTANPPDFAEDAYRAADVANAYYGHWYITFREHGTLTVEVLNPLLQGASRVVHTRKLKVVLKASSTGFEVDFPANNSMKLGMCLPAFAIKFDGDQNQLFVGRISVKLHSEDLDFVFQAYQGNVRIPANDMLLDGAGLHFQVEEGDESKCEFHDNTWRVEPKRSLGRYLWRVEDVQRGYRLAKVAVEVEEVETSQSATGEINSFSPIGRAQYIEIKVEAGDPRSLRVKTDEQIVVVNGKKLPQCFIEVLDAWGHRCALLSF